MKKIFLAIVIGVATMVALDFISGKVTSSMLAIPLSVFFGSCIAGYIANEKYYLIGLSVGCINVIFSLIIYFLFADVELLHKKGFTSYDVLAMPISTSVIFSLLGGILSGVLRSKIPVFIKNIKGV